jgi:hypothetical protein
LKVSCILLVRLAVARFGRPEKEFCDFLRALEAHDVLHIHQLNCNYDFWSIVAGL